MCLEQLLSYAHVTLFTLQVHGVPRSRQAHSTKGTMIGFALRLHAMPPPIRIQIVPVTPLSTSQCTGHSYLPVTMEEHVPEHQQSAHLRTSATHAELPPENARKLADHSTMHAGAHFRSSAEGLASHPSWLLSEALALQPKCDAEAMHTTE